MITIKKYPNRRLYDTSQSQYINLEDIKQLVLEHHEFRVIDSKSEDDLTKHILLQIISEQENNDQESLLTKSVLKQLIRFYGSNMQPLIRPYLEQSIATFLERQDSMQSVMKNMVEASPVGMFSQVMEQNIEMWKNMTQFNDTEDKSSNDAAPPPSDEPPKE